MGDNKITEAAVEAAHRAIYFAASPEATEADYINDLSDEHDAAEDVKAWMRAALEAALPHLQGEVVPLASEPAPNWCRTCGRRPNDPLAAFCLDTHHRTMERTHPQPAELSEVSGNSGELLDPMVSTGNVEADNAISRLMSDDPDFNDCETAAALIRRMALDLKGPDGFATWKDAAVFERQQRVALAATGKQQVGEVEERYHPAQRLADIEGRIEPSARELEGLHDEQAGEEVSVEEDVYYSIADMIEPYVQREGTNPDGPLPASVHDSVQIIFDHWLKTRVQVGEVQPVAYGQVTELRIPARNKLDPISVFVQDQAPGRGRIVVTCYGNAWQGFWGAMGDRTVMEFVAKCDADYVAGNMLSGRQTRIAKHEREYAARIAAEVIAEFRSMIDGRDAGTGVGP